MPHYTHVLGWLLGLEGVALLRAQAGDEPRWGDVPGGHGGSDALRYCPEAARAAARDTPALMVWHLERAA